MNIGYFADGPWGHRTFEMINSDSNFNIKFICVRHDSSDPIFKNYCNNFQIDYLKVKNINSSNFIQKIKKYECDLFVSMSFNQIFGLEIINLPPKKTINCHAGKLPFYRGRNILNWALINDEVEFGITVHYMDKGIDTGDIILQKTYPISDSDNYSTLLKKSYEECPKLLLEAVNKIRNNEVEIIKQKDIHLTGFYCSQRKKGDEIIDWNQSSRSIFNFIRAICSPGPRARTFHGENEVFINQSEFLERAPKYIGLPGVVLNKNEDELLVKTKDSFIKILDWESNSFLKIGSRLK
tara:strand:+ start:757 stop:1641 length:885 start_codon:yes stop_codon:yes gene_type:complete